MMIAVIRYWTTLISVINVTKKINLMRKQYTLQENTEMSILLFFQFMNKYFPLLKSQSLAYKNRFKAMSDVIGYDGLDLKGEKFTEWMLRDLNNIRKSLQQLTQYSVVMVFFKDQCSAEEKAQIDEYKRMILPVMDEFIYCVPDSLYDVLTNEQKVVLGIAASRRITLSMPSVHQVSKPQNKTCPLCGTVLPPYVKTCSVCLLNL